MKTVTVEIPVLVGSNGKWCASGWNTAVEQGPDWGFMFDSLESDDGSFPATERRYVVRATLIVPDEAPEVVEGTLEA